mgnify:FL=1|jgi:prefoldin subunit 5
MAKINFTKEHLEKMKELAIDMLLNNMSITTTMGTVLNISELMHTTTIGTLNKIRLTLTKKIRDAEDKDEWVDFSDSKYLDTIRKQKDLVNLIIGWKRYNMEKEANEARRKELEKKLDELKESQKTPEDKIKELEEEIKSLDNEVEF